MELLSSPCCEAQGQLGQSLKPGFASCNSSLLTMFYKSPMLTGITGGCEDGQGIFMVTVQVYAKISDVFKVNCKLLGLQN